MEFISIGNWKERLERWGEKGQDYLELLLRFLKSVSNLNLQFTFCVF